MREQLKGLLESAVTRSGTAVLARRRKSGATLVLAYHNIVPTGREIAGDRSLHLPQSAFARQLDTIERTHTVVTLDTLLKPESAKGKDRRPRVAITFDDACQGAVTVGVEELVSRGLPATVFVAPAFIGGSSFWWDALSREKSLTAEDRDEALNGLQGKDEEVRAWAVRSGRPLRDVPQHQTAATEEQLQLLDRTAGITLGSHTWSHPNLPRLSEKELGVELARPMAWLRERFRSFVPWLAYPYGLAGSREMAAAAATGYEGALMVDGGWLPRMPNRLERRCALPRLNVPAGISLHGFELRIAGLLHG